MDSQQHELLDQLEAIEAGLPKGTKMPNNVLDKCLGQALDTLQTFTEVIKLIPFNPTNLSKWSSSTCSKSLLDAVQCNNLIKAMHNATASKQMPGAKALIGSTSKEEIFMEVRQCMLQFANHYKQIVKHFVLQDEAQQSGIVVRVCCEDLMCLTISHLFHASP